MTKLPCRLLLAILVGLVVVTAPGAQEAPVVPVPFEGTEAFGHILHSFSLKPDLDLEEALASPDKTLIVIFGELRKVEVRVNIRRALEKFVDQGGALLVASDYDNGARLPFDLSCPGDFVHANGPSIYEHGEELWVRCPVVHHWTDSSHPLFKGVRKLATNSPSFFRSRHPRLACLADYAVDCAATRNEQPYSLPEGAGYIFGSPRNAPASGGRLVALAGQGVFLNGMLIQIDNDNFTFAWNTVAWLAQGPDGRRQKALFVNDGEAVNNFALPLSRLGPLPIPPIQVINRMIRGLEDENIFNRLLLESIGKEPYLRALLLLGSVAALVWGGWRLMHGRFHLDARVPLLVGKQTAVAPAVPVLAQRQEELRHLGNLWEPAQVLARQFFLDHGGLAVPLWDDEAAKTPAVVTGGGFWQRRTLARQVRELWKLARTGPARPVSSRQFDRLLRLLAELGDAVAAGQLAFTPPGH
jgi:hypothetical protein